MEGLEDCIKHLEILNAGKLKKILEDVPDNFHIAICMGKVNEVVNTVSVDVVDEDFGFVIIGGEPDKSSVIN